MFTLVVNTFIFMVTTKTKNNKIEIIKPQEGPQTQFLTTSADIAFFGGSAGSGKSYAILLDCLRHINNPNYGAVILRRTYPEIVKEGSLLDTSMLLYPHVGGVLRKNPLGWIFPSGAKISFSHCQYDQDVLNFQGSQITTIVIDELTNFATDKVFWYLFSRNRSTCGIRPTIRGTTNPENGSWVHKLIDWWIDPVTGLAIPERSGVIRYFIRVDGELLWADSPKELKEKHPELSPKSFTFIRSSIYDNKKLLEVNPEYLASLQALHPVDKARYLDGNWLVNESSGKFINRGWFEVVESLPWKD